MSELEVKLFHRFLLLHFTYRGRIFSFSFRIEDHRRDLTDEIGLNLDTACEWLLGLLADTVRS